MNATNFRVIWNALRIYALATSIIVLIFGTWTVYGHTVDFEGPSGEAIQAEKDYQNKQNEEAHERVVNGEEKPGDTDKSLTYMMENMVRSEERGSRGRR